MNNERQSRIKVRIENMDYDVVGADFQQILAAVKALPQRRFNSGLKLWEVSGSLEMARGQLENSGFTLEGGAPVAAGEQTAPPPSNDRIRVAVAGYSLVVSGAPFREMLEVIKALPGRRFDGETKQWIITGSLTELKAHFEGKGLDLATQTSQNDVAGLVASEQQRQTPPTAPPGDDLFPLPPDDAFADVSLPANPPPPPPLSDFPLPDEADNFIEDEGSEFDEFVPWDDSFSAPSETVPQMPPSAEPAPKPAAVGRRDQIRVLVGTTPMVVTGGSFKEMLAAVKAIPGRRFDMESKQWLLDDDPVSIQQHLASKGFQLGA